MVLLGALRFRLLLVGVAAGLIVLGAVSLRQMHTDVLPELSNGPVLEVQTEAPGLSSEEVEQYITVPMENNLLDGVMGVWNVHSQSIPGLSVVDLYFEPGTTELHARQLVEERLTNAYSLPNVAKPPLLIQPLSSASRALMIGLRSTTLNPLELSYLARWVVKPRLSGVPGVANIAIFGQQDRQIQVQVDPSRLAAHHVTLQDVIDTAGNAQLVSPLSYLQGAAPGTGGFLDLPNQRLEIRPVLPLGAPKDLATVPVSGAPGRQTLGSVANVVEGHQPLIGDALGTHGTEFVLLVQKLPSASLVGVTNGVERELAALRPALPGVSIDTSFFRPATYVSSALHNLALTLVIAAALGLIALAALFLELRAAFVAALSMALSLLVAALLLQALGYTLNALVVLGLLMASGVLVDDAVGATWEVVRGLRRHAQDGNGVPLQIAVLETYARLRGTLGFATLIVLVAVAPVFFASGLTAIYLHPMVLSFALAVVASAVIALTVTPALAMLAFAHGAPKPRGLVVARRLDAAYRRILQAALGIPRAGLACVCLLGLAGLVALPFLHQPAPPRFQDRDLVVQWNGPPGASLGEMDRVTQRMIGYLRALPSIADVAATIGRAVSADQIVDTNSGQIYVAVKRSANYDRAVAAVRAVVGSMPGMYSSVSTYESDVQAGVLTPASHNLTVRVFGEDYGELAALGARIESLMAGIHGLGQPHMGLPVEEPVIQVAVNDAAAHAAGVLPGDARRQASTLVSGLTVGNFFEQQAVFDVVVIGTPSVRANLNAVRDLQIDTSSGGHVPLSRIASVSVTGAPVDIQHEGLSRYLDVTAPVWSGGVGAAQSAIAAKLKGVGYPLDYHAEVVGGTPDSPTSHFQFLFYVLAAAVGVFLLAQAALDSWRLAALFMLTVPVSLAGGLVVALATGQAQSLASDAGLLAVLAFAARQELLQLANIRRRHSRAGGELTGAIVARAAGQRFGSALASALVLAAVMIPFVARGDIAGNELGHTFAAVVLGGLISALLVTQVLVPAMCLALRPSVPVVPDADGGTPMPKVDIPVVSAP